MWAIPTHGPGPRHHRDGNTPINYPDFASPQSGLDGQIGLDATNKWPPETTREWGKKLAMSDEVVALVTAMWSELGLPNTGKHATRSQRL